MDKKFAKDMFVNFLLIFLGVLAIVKFYRNNALLAIVLMAVSFIFIRAWNTKNDLIFYLIAAIIGPLAEIVCIYFGVWKYPNPSFLGIPIWLPFVWGISFLTIKRVSETLIRKFG